MADSHQAIRRALSGGLSAWLTYEALSGRAGLFSERYLALPIAQLLAANVHGEIRAEHDHPVLRQPGPGRPPQLDFVVSRDLQVVLAVETKWVDTGTSVADVVWDCVRLELAANYFKCDSLFVLAGTRHKVDAVLLSDPFNPKTRRGKPALILGLHGHGRLSVNIRSPKRAFGPALHRRLAQYPHVKYPQSFVSGHGTQIPRDAAANAYTAVVWHIRPEQAEKRYTFRVPSAALSIDPDAS